MSELSFVFGPNNSFFFDCPRSWKFHNLPPTLSQLFQSYMSPEWHIAQPYCLALAPQYNSPEPIWYIGCKVVAGHEKIFHSQVFFDQNYPDLAKWTKTIPNAPRACRITFGAAPYSYFACAPGCGSTWAGVPSELTDKVQKAFDTPCCVSLGVGDAWFVLWPDGYCAWKLYGNYGELEKVLTEATPRSISSLAISPYNPQHYFLSFRDGTVKYNFSGVPEWTAPIQEIFMQWQAEVMQRRQSQMQPPYAQPAINGPPGQVQWNQHNGMPMPTPGAPVYAAAHYANAHPPPPGMPQYNPYGNGVAPQNTSTAVELPGNMLEIPQPVPQRPVSILTEKKRKSFFSKAFGKA